MTACQPCSCRATAAASAKPVWVSCTVVRAPSSRKTTVTTEPALPCESCSQVHV